MSLGISKTLGLLHHQTDGSSLYQHLCETLNRLQEAEDPYKSFEMLSTYVRDVRLPKVKGADLEVPERDPRDPLRAEWAAKAQGLSAASASAQLGDVADFWAQSRLLRAAGLGFSEEECYTLALSIRNLALKNKAVSARFWGKILGTGADYYLTELELPGADKHNRAANSLEELREDYVEPRGVGANQYVYFVCSSPTGEWQQLPNAVPAQIKRSRQFNHLFSGNLDAPVLSHPPFPWTERELLRAMVARITHATMLAPDGYYKMGEGPQEGEMVKNPEFTLGGEAAFTPDKWVCCRAYLRQNGRVKYPEDPSEESGMPEEERARIIKQLEQERERDTWNPPGAEGMTAPAVLYGVQAVINDEKYSDKEKPWLVVTSDEKYPDGRFKVLGDAATYGYGDNQLPGGPKSYAVTLVESTQFPGAYTVAQGDSHVNVYLGYGVRKQRAFLPLQEMAPGPIMEEPTDLKELIQEPIEEEIAMDEEGEGAEDDE
jgi:radial spoke head protein 4A